MDCLAALAMTGLEQRIVSPAFAGRDGEGMSSRLRPRGAANIDHVAVTDRRILVDEASDQDTAVERDDLAILLAGGRACRADIVLAARRALEAQFLRGGLAGQMHHVFSGLAGTDHVRLLALAARGQCK